MNAIGSTDDLFVRAGLPVSVQATGARVSDWVNLAPRQEGIDVGQLDEDLPADFGGGEQTTLNPSTNRAIGGADVRRDISDGSETMRRGKHDRAFLPAMPRKKCPSLGSTRVDDTRIGMAEPILTYI